MQEPIFIIILVLTVFIFIGILGILYFQNKQLKSQNTYLQNVNLVMTENFGTVKKDLEESFVKTVKDVGEIFQNSQEKITKSQLEKLDIITENLVKSFDILQKTVTDSMDKDLKERVEFNKNILENQKSLKEEINKTLVSTNLQTEQKLENIRKTVAESITKLQEENSKKLDQMRDVVDEKLQKTLEERISKSFSNVSERLEEVHKGLGEMRTLATGVGDLKKVLTNVKTRGIMGEVQLQNIIDNIMSKDQYETNFEAKKGSGNRVEFAINFLDQEMIQFTYQLMLNFR